MSTKLYFMLIFVILFLHFDIGKCECSSDYQKKIATCYDTYLKSLERFGIISSFEEYSKSLSFYLESFARVQNLCLKYKILSSCITDSVAKECINKDKFKLINNTIWNDEPIKYVANYYLSDFMCGDGNNALNVSFDCLPTIRTKAISCQVVTNDCSLRKKEIDCYSNSTKIICGSNAQYYITQMLKIYLCKTQPQCNNVCKNFAPPFSMTWNNNGGFILFLSLFLIFLIKWNQ